MKLYFMLVRRVPPVTSPVLVEVFGTLTRRGFQIETGIAEEMVMRPDYLTVEHDLYLLKSHTELSLSLAGVLHGQGARLLNPYPCCMATQDKIMASRRLRAAGIPTPRSWVTGDLTLLRPIAEEMPLIIKPYRGHRGAGIHIVHNPDELAAVPPPEMPVLIQEYVPGSGEDVKVYVVGEKVFAVRKPFSPTSFTRPGRPYPVSAEVRDIARRCGQVFGLGLYGLDVVESPGGPVVVDLNYFPGYKGVPNVAPLIADYIEGYAREQVSLRLPGPALPARLADRPYASVVPSSRRTKVFA
ncbi:MAG: RimK family alpha-L-glutamate ligase [Anaerolineae bacterium]